MTKDTKQIIIHTLLEIAAQGEAVTVEEISRRSNITRNTIQRNFDNQGISGIVDFINEQMIREVNAQLFRHEADELPLEIFADILLDVMWRHRDEARVIFTAHLPLRPIRQSVDLTFGWLEKRYERLVKVHKLAPIFKSRELVTFYHTYIYGLLALWLSADVPVEPQIFKPKFLYLMKHSMYDLVYQDINS